MIFAVTFNIPTRGPQLHLIMFQLKIRYSADWSCRSGFITKAAHYF